MIRVLIVDDSPSARVLLRAALTRDLEIVIAGEAEDGRRAVELAKKLAPDVVTMDIELPGIDGYEATRMIMEESPVPVVVVTSLDTRDVERSLRSLQVGAVALVAKPPPPSSSDFARACSELTETIKAMAGLKVVRQRGPLKRTQPMPKATWNSEVIAIAASTGGPDVLRRILSELPATFSIPILIVQHIAPGFAEGLAQWLTSSCALQVRVAGAGEPLEPGSVFIARDGAHLGVGINRCVELSKDPPVGGFRPSGTVLFRSVASVFGPTSLGVVLTGMGNDGFHGISAVKRAGGRVIAQDEASSLVYGMPKAVRDAGLADASLSPDAIASMFIQLSGGKS